MAKHRAWRVRIEHTSDRACLNAATIAFFETKLGPDVTQGATGSVIYSDQGYDAASKAFDNNNGTLWHDSCGFSAYGYIGWDFGGVEANWKDVRGFMYAARPDNLANNDSMRSGGLEYSDDLVSWKRLFSVDETTNWNQTYWQQKYFWGKLDNLQDEGGFRYIQLECIGGIADYNGLSKVEFYNRVGENIGVRMPDSNNARRNLYPGGAPQDGSIHKLTELSGSPSDGFLQWTPNSVGRAIIFDFGSENRVKLGKMRVFPNRDGAGRTWTGYRIKGSNDGLMWDTIDEWTSAAWNAGEWQERVIPDYTPSKKPVAGAHRYWRWVNVYSPVFIGLSALKFADENRVPFVGTISASSTYQNDPNYAITNLTDDNPGTVWAANTGNPGEWVSYDYGTPVDPKYIVITARAGSESQAPNDFLVQYSDDGSNWITMSNIQGFSRWGSGETRHYDIYFTSYKIGWDRSQDNANLGSYVSMSEIRWMDKYGEPYDTPPYDPATMTYDYGASNNFYSLSGVVGLFDGQMSTDDGSSGFYWYGQTADDRYFIHRFPKDTGLAGIRIWARNNNNALSQSPYRYRIDRSDDNGVTYRSVGGNDFPGFVSQFQMQESYFTALSVPEKKDRWRLRNTEVNGSGYCAITEIEWRITAGGAQAATGGTVLSGATLSGYPDTNAYDGLYGGSDPAWVGIGVNSFIGYQFGNATDIAEYAVSARTSYPDQVPRSWVVEYSDDGGATWVIVDRRYSVTGWQDGVAKVFTIAPDTAPTADRHRYWRLLFDARNQYIGMRQLVMRDENGFDLSSAADLTVVGSQGVSEGVLSNLLTSTVNEYVYRATNVVTSLQFDYGINPREIKSYDIIARTGYSNNDCPRNWYLQWSDDAVVWTSVSRIDGQEAWIDNSTRSYKRDFTAWRLLFTANSASGYLAVSEIQFTATPGGPNLVTTERARIVGKVQDNSYNLSMITDGDPNSFWYVSAEKFSTGDPPYAGFRFDDDVQIAEVTIVPRQDGYANNDSPSEYTVQKSSDNGLSWQSHGYALNLYPWTAASRTMTVPATPIGFGRVSRAGMYIAEGPGDGAQVYRTGMYIAEGPGTGTSVGRVGMYIVEGPENIEVDDDSLYRPRQYFIN